MIKLGFIGVGKISSAVVKALCTSKMKYKGIYLSPRNEENSKHLADTLSNVQRLESNQLVLDNSDIIFLSLRPNDAKDILSSLQFKSGHTVVSFIPFLRFSKLSELVQPAGRISRAIPLPTVVDFNCPVPIFNSNKTVNEIFNYVGEPLPVENEDKFHVIWTLTGLIAPYYGLLSELSDWAVLNGVSRETANKYVADMFYSLSFYAKKKAGLDFKELVADFATHGGMNEQAVKEIDQKGAQKAYKSAANNLLKLFSEKL